MAGDRDTAYIAALFGAGIALMLTAFLAFGDGEAEPVLLVLAVGLVLATIYAVVWWRRRVRRR
jgi:hypothetical protein